MVKVIYWSNPNNRAFKLTPWYIKKLDELGFKNIPHNVGEYNNEDTLLIKAVEERRKDIPQILLEELYQCMNYQSLQSHFTEVHKSFEAFSTQLWIKVLEENPQLFEVANLERLYNALVYLYSTEDLPNVCKDWNIKLSNNIQNIFNALISRRDVVQNLREKRDNAHDMYLKFCADIGMRTFSHIPPNDGFKIVEYDETKYRAKITIQTNSLGFKYEELELIPI